MANLKKPFIIRVTGFDTNDRAQAETILQSAIRNQLINEEQETLSKSFSILVVPSCNNEDSCDAIVDFKAGFPLPLFLLELQKKPLESISVQIDDNPHTYLTFDCHFHGFTQLYPTPDRQPINADIIAITGLDGHAYGSWTSKSFPWPMWLRHFLARDRPQCRTMIYGYNSKLSEYRFANIQKYCQEFLQLVRPVRMKGAKKRPVFFIAHSFGGIILARSLVKAQETAQETDATIAALFLSTYAVMFFAVPHYGIVVDDMMKMLGPGHPREQLLKELSSGQNSLGEQLEHFINIIEGRKIVSFVEAQQTKRLFQDPESGKWARSGEPSTVLPYEGAILKLPEWIEQKYTIHEDHSMIVKFSSKTVTPYKVVLQFLKEFEKNAPAVVRKWFSPSITRSSASTIPFGRDPNFVGRRSIINEIVSFFKKYNRVGIYGLGGIGKSQIAIEYAYQLRNGDPDIHLFWVHASNPERCVQSFQDIAITLDIPRRDAKKDTPNLVAQWLKEEHNGHWLLILDNADDLEVLLTKHECSNSTARLIDFIPDVSHGKILVTSRVKSVAGSIAGYQNLQQVKEMEDGESLQLMKKLLETGSQVTDAEARPLLESLDGNPLAIAQACAYLNENSLVAIPRYIELISQDGNELLRHKWLDLRRDRDAPSAVIDSLELSLRYIRDHFPQAAELLSVMSMFNQQKIPKFLIRSYRQSRDFELLPLATRTPSLSAVFRMRKTIGDWRVFWNRRSSASKDLYTHQENSAEISSNISTKPFTGDSGTHANANSISRDVDEIAIDEALSHLLDFSLIKIEPDNMFEIHPVVQMAIRAWHQAENTLHLWQNTALNTIAYVAPDGAYENWTTWNILLPHVETVLADQQDGMSDSLVRLLLFSAWCLCGTGNYKLAETRAAWSLEIARRRLGEKNLYTLKCMSHLALAYRKQGRWNEAEKLDVRVMKMRKRVLGREHPETLSSMANLSMTYRDQDRRNEAEKVDVRVMKMRKRVRGEEHLQTLISMTNIALMYRQKERFKEAEELLVQVMETGKGVFGAEHSFTLKSMGNLAINMKSQDRNEEAIMLMNQCFRLQKTKLGLEHPDTQYSLKNLKAWELEADHTQLNPEDQS